MELVAVLVVGGGQKRTVDQGVIEEPDAEGLVLGAAGLVSLSVWRWRESETWAGGGWMNACTRRLDLT